jgi:hypothetical protein
MVAVGCRCRVDQGVAKLLRALAADVVEERDLVDQLVEVVD